MPVSKVTVPKEFIISPTSNLSALKFDCRTHSGVNEAYLTGETHYGMRFNYWLSNAYRNVNEVICK